MLARFQIRRLLNLSNLTKLASTESKSLTKHNVIRNSSNTSSTEDLLKQKDSWVVLSDDGQTILCWHPEVPFPYEHSKPLPKFQAELREEDSILKIQYRLDDKNRFSPDGPTDEELQKLTYTTKHRWFKKPEKKYRDPNPPRDRDGI